MKLANFTVSVEVFNQQDSTFKRVVSPVFSFMVFDCLPTVKFTNLEEVYHV
jgi:hypothetical protein